MLICKIISLGIKHIEIFDVRYFLNPSIKLYDFSIFSSSSYSLHWLMAIVDENVFFQHYNKLNFIWTFHWKLSLDWKCQYLGLCLQPWYADQKWLLHCSFVNIGSVVSDLRSRWPFTVNSILIKQSFIMRFFFSTRFKVFICENGKLPL